MKYSYNGVVLPELPEWDRETYPYVHITDFSANSFQYDAAAYMTSEPMVRYTDNGMLCADGRISFKRIGFRRNRSNENEWVSYAGFTQDDATSCNNKADWANYDIPNSDGTPYLSASYPIDTETGKEVTIYDPNPIPVLNPTAILMGYSMGAKL